ncbi:MAG TPA: ABC transporter permease [Planctomycetota bacterium]|nr:ABC transporter permease [Planctomycetota bacterium]
MPTYILKRLLLAVPTLFGITFISFFVMQLAPGKPGGQQGDQRANKMTTKQWEVLERTFHLNQPIHLRYFYWLGFIQEPVKDSDKVIALSEKLTEWNALLEEKTVEAEARRARALLPELQSGAPIDPALLRVPPPLDEMPPKPTLETVSVPKTGLIYGDFGYSMQMRSIKVITRVWEALPITLLLNVLSFLLIYTLSIPLGIYSATHRHSTADHIITVGSFLLYSLPNFWVAVLLIKLMVSVPVWMSLPIQGIQPDNSWELGTFGWLLSCSKYLILPVICLSYNQIAGMSRYMRTGMINEVNADYVRTARSKGLREGIVIYKHALRNSLIPIITLLGSELPALISGSVIIEAILGIPGMGNLGYQALLARDYTVLMADLTLVAVLVMVGFIVSDFLYTVADPRISLEGGGK